VPSLKIDSNALDAMRNVGAYVEGIATATRSFDIDKEIGQAITTIAKVSLGKFIDSEARLSPKALHHVYEWNQTGKPLGRLWKIDGTYKAGSIVLSSEFRPSKTFSPNKYGSRRSKFIFKAEVMEKGQPVRITARNAQALHFYSKDGDPVFIPRGKYVTVKTPGGKEVKGSYRKTMNRFLASSRLLVDIQESGIIARIEAAQAMAGREMPAAVSGRVSTGSFKRIAESNVSKHIRQVTRAYQYADEVANG
jgi:hypothetical protein